MLAGNFQAKLRKCNSKLRIYCGDDDSKPAGIFHVDDPEAAICGIDKNSVPEWSVFDEVTGKVIKGGWRRAMRLLIEHKYVDRRKAERVFGTQIIGTRRPPYLGPAEDRIQKEITAAYKRGMMKNGKPALTRTEVMDIASEITKNANQ